MVDMQYKKGELLLEETFETSKTNELYPFSQATLDASTIITDDIVIINFNGDEYTCLKQVSPTGIVAYGGITASGTFDFTDCPFAFMNVETEGPYMATLYTENPGTYTVKVYTAIEDSDSTESNPVITYLMSSPSNTNWNVLSSMLGDGDWSKLKKYVETTPYNMNRMVLESLLSSESGNSNVVGNAVVDMAVAG